MPSRVRLPGVPEELGPRALRRLRAPFPPVPPAPRGPTVVARVPTVAPAPPRPPRVRVEPGDPCVAVGEDGARIPFDPDDPASLAAAVARLVEPP